MSALTAHIGAAVGWIGGHLTRIDAPVLVQEMRVRQRGIKPFATMLVYLLVLSIAAMIILFYHYPDRATAGRLAELGRNLYLALTIIQLVMVCLIVPAYSSASVCGERERGTFDLLSLTLLSSRSVVDQKLIAAMAQALLLIFASLPVMAIVFLLGGVSPLELLLGYGLLLVTALFLGSLGMLCSCCVKSSKTSTFLTYLIMFCIFLGLPIGNVWLLSRTGYSYYHYSTPIWALMLIFLFVGGVGAVLIYAPASLIFHNKPIWGIRAFRMAVFGAGYALLLLFITCPAIGDILLNSRTNGIPVTCYINPAATLAVYVKGRQDPTMVSAAYWMFAATAIFTVGCTLAFRSVSSARFAGLRIAA